MHQNPNRDRGQEGVRQVASVKPVFELTFFMSHEPLDPTTGRFTHPDICFGGDNLVVVEVHHLRGTI